MSFQQLATRRPRLTPGAGLGRRQPIPVSLSGQPIPETTARTSRVGQAIGRTPYPGRATVQDMGVDLGGGDVPVPQQLLHGSDVVPVLQQVGRERMAEGVRRRPLCKASFPDRRFHLPLDHRLVQVVPPFLAGRPIHIQTRGREDPLPRPLATRIRILPGERGGKLNPACRVLQVALMLSAHRFKWRASADFTAAGSIVTRSLSPLPLRTTIWLAEKSTSWTRSGSTPAAAGLLRRAGRP